MTRVVFLVPRRKDGGHRDKLWTYCRGRWERYFPDIEIYEGHHEGGPFSRSAAVNRAADAASSWDLGIVIDSDVMESVSSVRAAIDTAQRTGLTTWAHRRWRGIREDMAVRIVNDMRDFGPELNRDEMDLMVERTNPISWSCCMVIPRATWDDLGGFDERFRGWGFEDMAIQSVICGLYGHERIDSDVIHLWHERSEERITPGETRLTATPEYVTNARLGRRYMVALRRDHKLHDRPGLPASEEERLRDIQNLLRDDAKYGPAVSRLGLPNWDGWWPTLEELRDGARAVRGTATRETAVILRTGGEKNTFEDRLGYLRQSIASLSEQLRGPVVQRVIYADWDPPETARIGEVATQHGFYVVGPGRHLGYTPSVQTLWRYIERRIRTPFVFLTEDDFVYDKPVDLTPMIETLESEPDLKQIALLRNAYPSEAERGGILGWPTDSFTPAGNRLEHRNFWTMNPSLMRSDIVSTPWPASSSSERGFGDSVLRDGSKVALWGDGQPWIRHIGAVRAGTTY